MTDMDLTAARAAIVRVAELLERAESKGASAVYVSEIRDAIREVLPPAWWPPRPGDIVLDTRGDMWRWGYDCPEWQEIRGEYAHKMDRLAELFGPLDLIVRDGKRYDG